MGDMCDMDMVPWCFLSKRSGGRPTVAVFFFPMEKFTEEGSESDSETGSNSGSASGSLRSPKTLPSFWEAANNCRVWRGDGPTGVATNSPLTP